MTAARGQLALVDADRRIVARVDVAGHDIMPATAPVPPAWLAEACAAVAGQQPTLRRTERTRSLRATQVRTEAVPVATDDPRWVDAVGAALGPAARRHGLLVMVVTR